MGFMAGLYPFYLLGKRRTADKAGVLSLAIFFAAAVAFIVPMILCSMSHYHRSLGLYQIFELPYYLDSPRVLMLTFSGWFYLACFLIPFLSTNASDFYFRNDWRANSIILVTPLSSRDMFFGKFAVLFTVGLFPLILLIPPLALIMVGMMASYDGLAVVVLTGLFAYSVSVFFLAGFTRRWEALLFWMFLYPLGGLMNGILYVLLLFWFNINDAIHQDFPTSWIASVLPQQIGFPSIPTWVMSLIAVVITAVLIIRKGTGEIQKMRTGLIPFGRLTEKTVNAYRKEKEPWYTPEFVRPERAPKTQMEIYIDPMEEGYKPSSTDKFFNFIAGVFFLGKQNVLRLTKLLPGFIRESPIYMRHTARFRGFLDGYYEPSSTLKSRVVAAVILLAIFNPLFWVGVATLSQYKGDLAGIILVIGSVISVLSSFDAYIRLSRYHRESMAWESIIIAPIEARSLIAGTFGILLTHRLIPYIPSFIYIFLISLAAPQYIPGNLLALILVHSLHFAGLSIASGISWQIARRGITGGLLTAWIAAVIAVSVVLVKYVFVSDVDQSVIMKLVLYGMPVAGLILVGIFSQIGFWHLFERYTRHPLDRGIEEGG